MVEGESKVENDFETELTSKADPQPANDPERGREIFMNGGLNDSYKSQYYCIHCHSLDGSDGYGPSLKGIGERAGNRNPGLSAAEYIRQSIVDPRAYIVEDFESMGRVSSMLLSEEELADVIAFALTQ